MNALNPFCSDHLTKEKPQSLPLYISLKNKLIVVFHVELAITESERQTGLMYRHHLPLSHGMLFLYQGPAKRTVWMKNTFVSLDLIFIKNRKIVEIISGTEPLSEELIQPINDYDMLLEIGAGSANRFSLSAGDSVQLNGARI